ncbi:MAG: type 1 glutamine amidotransferase, partial [Pseudomonadota bacterium]
AAYGGRAELSDKGWGIGVQSYQVHHRAPWMVGAGEAFSLHAMHRDQVTAIAPDATVLAGNAFCPYAMLAYGDPAAPEAISIQPHPEFERPFAEELVSLRTGDGKIPREVGEPALRS